MSIFIIFVLFSITVMEKLIIDLRIKHHINNSNQSEVKYNLKWSNYLLNVTAQTMAIMSLMILASYIEMLILLTPQIEIFGPFFIPGYIAIMFVLIMCATYFANKYINMSVKVVNNSGLTPINRSDTFLNEHGQHLIK